MRYPSDWPSGGFSIAHFPSSSWVDPPACCRASSTSKLASPGAHVVVEPNPELIPVLQRNRDLNRCSFSISTPVEAVTFLDLLERFGLEMVTLVCDIEGVEIDLLTHEEATVAAHVAWIIVELHEPISGRAAVEGFLRRVDTAGFALVWERGWTRVFRNRRWSQEGATGRRRSAAASRRALAD